MFYNLKVKVYPHKTLNKFKGVVRSTELSLCSIKEIEKELKNQGVSEAKRITSWRNNQPIKTNTYILTFDKPKILKEIKIDYTIAKVEPYILNPLRCLMSKIWPSWGTVQRQDNLWQMWSKSSRPSHKWM